MVHQADAEMDDRMRRAACLMLRSVAPLVASLDKLKYLPIDPEEHPYPTTGGRGALALAAAAPALESGAGLEGQEMQLRSVAALATSTAVGVGSPSSRVT